MLYHQLALLSAQLSAYFRVGLLDILTKLRGLFEKQKRSALGRWTLCRWLCRPVVIEVPHFASLRDGEREISILRNDDGQTWKPHVQAASDSHKDVQDVIRATTGGTQSCSSLFTA